MVLLREIGMNSFSWKGDVRAHEIDAQGIVNNAHYLSYFDHERTLHFKMLGVDWVALSQEGFDLVLVHSDIHFKHPLRAFDSFEVSSVLHCEGRLKMIFTQRIVNANNTLICSAINTVVCVDRARQKPIAIQQVMNQA